MRKSFALIATLFLVACGVQSEDALRQQFTEYKSTIRQILEMQDQDTKVVRIAPTFTRLENDWSWPRKDITAYWVVPSPPRGEAYRVVPSPPRGEG